MIGMKQVGIMVLVVWVTILAPQAFGQTGSQYNDFAKELNNRYGSDAGFQQNVILQDGTNCPKTTRFLELYIDRSGSGDITARINQDTSFDSAINYTYSPPLISGVCTDGIASCAPGTWDNCQAYKWTSNFSGQVSLQPVEMKNLSGCDCINNSCTGPSVWDENTLLTRLGRGTSLGVSEGRPKIAMMEAGIVSGSIVYHAYDLDNCIQSSGPGLSDPEKYFGDSTARDTDSTTLESQLSSDSSGLYNQMKTRKQNFAAPDTSELEKSAGCVNNTMVVQGNDLGYQPCVRDDTGTYSAIGDIVTLQGDEGPYEECVRACKTMKVLSDTNATEPGHPWAHRYDPSTTIYYYKACGDDNTCPAGPQETIVEDCGCLGEEDWKSAAPIIALMGKAQQDVICSNGVKR